MKKILKCLILSFVMIIGFNCKAYAANNNWMGSIPNNRYVSQLSIPGTHDSGALYEPVSGTAKCQNLNIYQQLNAGVRFLDVRCRRSGNSFVLHHGSVYQHANFDDVLNMCGTFLRQNPSETIIMSLKEEYNAENSNRNFDDIFFNNYVARDRNLWYLGDRIPTMGEARGKIVLVRRFGGTIFGGINATRWQDNAGFTINNNANLYVQDFYKVSDNSHKWNEIYNTMNTAYSRNYDNTLYLNFTSGYKSNLGVPNITSVSNGINPNLRNFFGQNIKGRFGVIIMDFADEDLCSRIIRKN